MRTRVQKVIVVAVSAFLALGLAACSGSGGSGATKSSGSKSPVKIGVLLSFGGSLGAGGLQQMAGIQYYVDQVNATGGVGGHQIEIEKKDDNSDVATSIQQFNLLANDPDVVAVIGPAGSGETAGVKPVAEQLGVPLIGAVAAAALSNPPTHWWFRSYVPDALQTQALLKVAATRGKTAVIVYPDDAFGQSGDQAFKQYASAAGVTIKGEVSIPANATDPSIQVIKAIAMKPDFYIFWDGSNVARLAQEVEVARQNGVSNNTLLVLPQPAGQDAFVQAAGSAANGAIYFGQMATNDPLPGAQTKFATGYKAATGDVPDESVLQGYASISILGEGLKQAAAKGAITRASVRNAIQGIKGFDSVLGSVTFDPTTHNPVTLKEVGVNTFKDGKRVRYQG